MNYYHDIMQLIGPAVDALVAPTLEVVLMLALVVIIRTFLRMTFQLEVEGRWPWRRGDEPKPG